MTLKQPFSEFPDLRIVPVGLIIPHELHDRSRADPLIDQLRRDRILKSPVLVTEFRGANGALEYLILDGTNRSISLDLLGIGYALVQVVPYHEPYVTLSTWNHAVSELSSATLEHRLTRLTEMRVTEDQPERFMVCCRFAQGPTWWFVADDASLQTRAECLQAVVAAYITEGRLDRVTGADPEALAPLFPRLTAVIEFPTFQPAEIVELTQHGWRVPAGITRHLVRGRALRVNYPLEKLSSSHSVEEKNEELRSWLQEKIANRQARFYGEPTVLFDE